MECSQKQDDVRCKKRKQEVGVRLIDTGTVHTLKGDKHLLHMQRFYSRSVRRRRGNTGGYGSSGRPVISVATGRYY